MFGGDYVIEAVCEIVCCVKESGLICVVEYGVF